MSKVISLPIGLSLSIRQIAEETGFDRDTVVKKMTESGTKPSGKRGGHSVYRLRDAIKALYISGPDGRMDPDKMDPFRRKAHYQAEHEALQLAKERGEVVPCIEVEQEQARNFKVVVQMLDTLSDTLERDAGLTKVQAGRVDEIVDATRRKLYSDLVEDDNVNDGALRASA